VFVGPNNSGKSKALEEIEAYSISGQRNANNVILEDMTFLGLSRESAENAVSTLATQPNPNESIPLESVVIASRRGRYHVNREQLTSSIQNPQNNLGNFTGWFLNHFYIETRWFKPDRPYQSAASWGSAGTDTYKPSGIISKQSEARRST
jgi:hypothetical protein